MKYGKVLTYKDIEEAKKLVGKEVIGCDYLSEIENKPESRVIEILCKMEGSLDPFVTNNDFYYQFIREVIEEPKLMTNRQLSEWIGKRIGEYTYTDSAIAYTSYGYSKSKQNDPVPYNLRIRSWDSDEWVLPTVDIYERDCKGGNK